MALSPKKLQQKKAAKKKKRTNNLVQKKQALINNQPIYEVLIDSRLWHEGIGICTIARENALGGITMAIFKIDVYCLGVKDCFIRKGSFDDYFGFRSAMQDDSDDALQTAQASELKALVLESVTYAKSLGFEPQGDYVACLRLFANVQLPKVQPDFQFGQDGKPCFISGPDDSPEYCEYIAKTLSDNVGDGNFEYIVGSPFMDGKFDGHLQDHSHDGHHCEHC